MQLWGMSGLSEGPWLPSLMALLPPPHTPPVLWWQVYAHAGATLEGKMYVTCGRRGEDYLKETHCYDPDSNTWHSLADGPVRRAWHGMATLLDKLYVIGGSNNDAGYRRDVHQVSRAGLPVRVFFSSLPVVSGEKLIAACMPLY